MGSFSSLCEICGKGINSDSVTGEYCKLFLLVKGKVIETMSGQYDSYGRVFSGKDHPDSETYPLLKGKGSFE